MVGQAAGAQLLDDVLGCAGLGFLQQELQPAEARDGDGFKQGGPVLEVTIGRRVTDPGVLGHVPEAELGRAGLLQQAVCCLQQTIVQVAVVVTVPAGLAQGGQEKVGGEHHGKGEAAGVRPGR